MKAYHKQQDEIAHIKKFIASAGTYANLVSYYIKNKINKYLLINLRFK